MEKYYRPKLRRAVADLFARKSFDIIVYDFQSIVRRVMGLSVRAFRHIFADRSYERYYSPQTWEQKYRDEKYDLSSKKEDARYGALLQVLRRYDRGTMLDLGCGDGLLWNNYRPLSKSPLIGIDYSATAVAKANALNVPNCRFECGDYRSYRPHQKISVVVFNESLYYVEDFLDAMHKCSEWVSQRGVIVVSMFDTSVTKRIWKKLLQQYSPIQHVTVRDHESGCSWTIRVFLGEQTLRP
jgi:SAM-dependent methyltransferase